jgi:hypothetical protein
VSETAAPPTWALVAAICCWATAQYGLAYWTLRDLARRGDVSGGSKTAWALGVLALPVIGPLAYIAVHPVPPPAWMARTPAVVAAALATVVAATRERLPLLAARTGPWLDRLAAWRPSPPRWLDRPPRWTVPPRMPRDRDVLPPSERP